MRASSDATTDKFDPTFVEWMEFCDQILAQEDAPLYERPLRAATLFVRHAVVRVGNPSSEEVIDGPINFAGLINKAWFGGIVRMVEAWYAKMFGAAALQPSERTLSGAVIHRGALQVLQIPGTVTQRADLDHQLWISFPDHVDDSEDVLSWIRPKFARSEMQAGVLADLESQVRLVASAIRFIASRARNASKGAMELRGLLAGGVRNLEAFPQLAASERPERQKAWWELQMANESFLKAFCLQQARPGGYRKIHSLPELIGDARGVGLEYPSNRFSSWPVERQMSDYRYATGPSVTSIELFSAYQLSLDLCRTIASSLTVRLDTGTARFLIQPLPWRLRELGLRPGQTEVVKETVEHPGVLPPDTGSAESAVVSNAAPVSTPTSPSQLQSDRNTAR